MKIKYIDYLKKDKLFSKINKKPLNPLKSLLKKPTDIFKKEVFKKLNKVNFTYQINNDFNTKKYIDLIQLKLKILEKLTNK